MEALSFIMPLVALAGAGAIALVIVAIVQDLRQDRKYGYRQAFFTIVTLAMLVLAVGSGISLLVIGLKESAFRGALTYSQRYNAPPAPYLTGSSDKPFAGTAYTCEKDCQFSATDKQSFSDWKTSYQQWQKANMTNMQLRRDLAGALSMFLIVFPLYLLFARMMNRGAKEEFSIHNKPSPVRAVYFYGVSFAGLVIGVIGAAMILNSVLRVALKTESSANTPVSKPTGVIMSETAGADSVIACASKCGFSEDDLALVRQWKADQTTYQERQSSNAGAVQNDMANSIPLLIFGAPLFWYHFTRIRKETAVPPGAATLA